MGFDLPNDEPQRSLVTAEPSTAHPTALLASVTERLEPLGLTRSAEPLTALAYLIELGGRYFRHEQAAAGARVGRIQSSLLQLTTHAPAALPSGRKGNIP